AFIRRVALEHKGGLNESLHFCMDYDLWLHLALFGRINYVRGLWSKFRVHPRSKGNNLQAQRWAETAEILSNFFTRPDIPQRWEKYRAKSIGNAHWRAAVEYFRLHTEDRTNEHIRQAIEFDPQIVGSREFAGLLVGSFADQITSDVFAFIDRFLDLIPSTV